MEFSFFEYLYDNKLYCRCWVEKRMRDDNDMGYLYTHKNRYDDEKMYNKSSNKCIY